MSIASYSFGIDADTGHPITWEDSTVFPTFEPDETKVRSDMQRLFTILMDCLNNLVGILNNTEVGTSGASNISIAQISGIDGATNVQDALALLQSTIQGIEVGQLGADSVATVMLQALCVTTAKLADLCVTTPKLADSAVTPAKTNFSSGLTTGPLTLNGALDANGKIFLDSNCYGDSVPSEPGEAEVGRLFFVKAT